MKPKNEIVTGVGKIGKHMWQKGFYVPPGKKRRKRDTGQVSKQRRKP